MQKKRCMKTFASRVLVAVLTFAMVFTMMPLIGDRGVYAAEGGLETTTPVLVVTGQGLLGSDGTYSADNVSKEKSYSLEELKALDGVTGQIYSARKSKSPFTRSYSLVDGVKISSLLDDLATYDEAISIIAEDGYAATFVRDADYSNDGKTVGKPGLDAGRYYYEGFDAAKKTEVPAVISWAYSITEGSNGEPPTSLPTATEATKLRLFVGQYDGENGGTEDMNQPLFNGSSSKGVNRVIEGDEIDEVILTVGGKQYTRADVLLMPFAERTYNYTNNKGPQTDTVRGVPFSVLLAGEDENSVVTFDTVDSYDKIGDYTRTVKQLIDGNYMLAYQVNGNGYYKTSKSNASQYGFLALYGDDINPAGMVNEVSATSGGIDYGKSPYKHVTNGGVTGQNGPYDIDSITGATLTIEGPGVKTSVPLSVRDLETRSTGCYRDVYEDTRSGSQVKRTYEGVDLYYLLHNMNSGSNGIVLTDEAHQVKIKNRNRNTIASFTLEEIEQMHNAGKPALIAYGTANEDGTNSRPFVFDGATGEDQDLGNGDGCLKFVYDTDTYGDQGGKYTKFGNMAYVYVEEEAAPGFKHTEEGSPYNVTDNTEALISITGDTLGREVNYTIKDIEDMVVYKDDGTVDDSNGYGYRDNYSLTNTTYWYVNEYEGVKLWSLLLRSGLDPALASDDVTKINYLTSDNYAGTDKFTIKQTADENAFGFYEKNALDNNDGSYEPNENLRTNNDPATGDKLKEGYPVLLAYGMNGYPYVISSKLDGYKSGLSNDGGPVRVISGKLNYGHNNGSSQAQKLSGIVVGENKYHYATHKYHSDKVYTDLAENELTVNVNTVKGGETKTTTKTYTIGDIEDINYDGSLTPTKLKEAKVKAKYNTGKFADLYEGVNLSYFLKDVVELSGSEGTVTFTASDGTTKVTLSLADVLTWDQGYCADSGIENLVPVIAYGKNGMPMVKDKDAAGYVGTEILAEGTKFENELTVKNQNGPLQMVFPGSRDGSVAAVDLKDLATIDIDLSSDKYAHMDTPYDAYENNKITISGEGTKLIEAKEFTVAELEGKQSLAGTFDYSIRKSSGSTSTQRYRGIRLYDLLKSTNVGLKSNADKVIVTTRDGMTKEFGMSDIIKSDYINSQDESVTALPVILAYGSASTENADRKDGKPLVSGKESEGYDAAYGNSGGPLKLVVGQTDAENANGGNCLSDVVSIEITASPITSWNHSSSSTFESYLSYKVSFEAVDSDNKELFNKELTVKEIEDMTGLVEKATLHLENDNEWEGLNFWNLIQTVMGSVSGINDPVSIYVYSRDGFNYNVLEQGLDAVKNGVKEGNDLLPILLAYGCDTVPLAQFGKNDPAGPGYDSSLGNSNGPLRLVIHNANGKSAGNVARIVVKVGDAESVTEAADFTIGGIENGELSIADLKKLTATEKEYSVKGVTEKVRGVLLKDLLASVGVEDEDTAFIIDAGGFAGEETYTGLNLKDAIAEEYLVAYEEFIDGEWKAIDDTSKTPNSKVRIYRNYLENHPDADQTKWFNKCQYITGITVSVPQRTVFDEYTGSSQPGELPLAGIRSTAMDKDGTLWIGTYGGGVSYKTKDSDSFVTYNMATEPALETSVVSAVCPDGNGGVWMTQNASYTNPGDNRGVIYMKDGKLTYFRAPDTVPNDYVQEIKTDKSGNVWFGSFGGLTKYDPKAGTWQTWDTDDGFPAMSVDNIEFDKDGGIWCGFYPESEASDGSKPFIGGFAYFKDGKVVKSYQYTSAADTNTGAQRLGDVWVRDIVTDANGGAWIVASGSYGGMANTGGRVWYVNAPGNDPIEYTGFDLFGEESFTTDSELRMVTVDPDGGLWFGTSADGIFHVADPQVIGGKFNLTEQFSTGTKSWKQKNANNIYSLDFFGNTLYAGSSSGLATHEFKFGSDEPDEPDTPDTPTTPAGDATAETADLTVTGSALARDGYFTIKGIKNAEGITKLDNVTFHTLNSSGTEADIVVSGATLEDIFTNVIGLAEGVTMGEVKITSADGKSMTYTANEVLSEDLQGNKAMFIWTEDGNKVTKTAMGQFKEGQANKGKWAKDVVKIEVFADEGGSQTDVKNVIEAISDLPEADKITVDDAEAIRAARAAYEALSDAEKALVENVLQLEIVEAALDNVIRVDYIDKGETVIDEIDYTEYSSTKSIGLNLNIARLESKLAKAETAAEAEAIYKQINELLENTPTLVEEKKVAICSYNIWLAATSGTNHVTLSWDKNPKADSYKVYRAESKSGTYKLIKTTADRTYKDYSGSVEKTYYYKVVPRVLVEDTFVTGNDSNIKSGKAKLARVSISGITAGRRKATVKWKSVKQASGYVIYRSTSKSSGFKAVKTVKKGSALSFTNYKLRSGRNYYFKIRAYKVVNGKRVYGSYSYVKRITVK